MIIGIIYKYTSPSGKSYIGQTTNEPLRRKNWFNSKYHYAGRKIDRARKKYGRDKFSYEILIKNTYSSREIAVEDLNRLEIYYIGLYDSYRNGYNSTIGGDGVVGLKLTLEQIEKVRKANLGRTIPIEQRRKASIKIKALLNEPEMKKRMSIIRKGKPNPKAIKAMSESNCKPILQLNLSGKFIREFDSIKSAIQSLGIKAATSNISNVCKGKRNSAYGFKLKYKEE